MRTTIHLTTLALCLSCVPGPARAEETSEEEKSAAPVDFAREVLPVLSEKCFVCHGPDTRRKNFLRLDSFAAATRDLGGYKAIDPDALEDSEILARINDPDDPMPPEDAEKKLTARERELIGRWIRQGGEYATHWAFVPPRKREPRESEGAAIDGEIDAFILEQLRERGISFAPEADRPTLARRLALVLTGLPPEPEQLAEFLTDERPDAYERLVDDLLGSPRYGEHQARYWLDAVRYGDTHGLHLDNRRGIYPYRDWVVRAFNENLPLDEFLTWQLAGDLLPTPTLEQEVATGFVRMNPTTSEGGVLPEEFQAKNNFDRTETLGTALLGMSLTCARCHTHKYDPIPQTEYYRLLAFFNSTAERSLDGNSYTYGPVIRAPENQSAWNEWTRLEAMRDRLLTRMRVDSAEKRAALVAEAEARGGWTSSDWRISKAVAVDAPAPGDASWEPAKGLPGARSDKLPGPDQAVWVSFRVTVPTDQVLWLRFSGGRESRVFVGDDTISALDGWTDGRHTTLPLALSPGTHRVRLKLQGLKPEAVIEARLESAWEAVAEAKSWEASSRDDRLRLLAEPVGPFADLLLQSQARALARRIDIARSSFTTTLVARDLPSPRPTRLLRRGEYNLPTGDPLEPGVLTVMSAFPEGEPRNRLGLARWLTSRDHPLVARVLINRVWQRVFGEGLVRTPEDFGLQGQQPTHPALLDWLAVELQDSGWDLKHMLRLMVTSRTFRQHSSWRDAIDDPENRLWARGPRFRLDAEVIRDIALWASGLLDPVMGGEGVKPYQPSGLWFALAHPASNTKRYVRDKGRKIYRRSLYVYWKRTSPHPMMTLFDAPSREASCVRRSRTNTPLQSLGLFNETQRLEMARVFAERLLRARGDDAGRLNLLFTLLACREPTEPERSACATLLETMRERYSSDEEAALSLLAAGDAPRDEALAPVELAAWSQVVITVLASDLALLLY